MSSVCVKKISFRQRTRSISMPTLAASAMMSGFSMRTLDPQHPGVFQTPPGDHLGQRLHKVHMPSPHDVLYMVDHLLIGNHVGDIVVERTPALLHAEVDIDDHPLGFQLLMVVDAERCHDLQIAHEHMAHACRGHLRCGPWASWWRSWPGSPLYPCLAGRYSRTSTTSGVCHTRCWPPSSTIICPVMAGADRM